jgi:hypothetical protein
MEVFMTDLKLEDWFPMSPLVGPPLPKWLALTWPWYKGEEEPPEGYTCPYCGEKFETYDELVAHIMAEHPGERIPIDIIWQ